MRREIFPGDEVPGGHDGRCVPAPWQLNLELRAECVVDLILGCAPQVSGKFLVYSAVLEGSMAVAVVSSDTGTLGIHTPAQPSPAASSVIEYSHRGSEGAGTGHIWSGIHTFTLLNYMIISLIVIYVNKLQKSTFNFPSSILNPSSVSIHKQQSTLILSLIQVCIMSCIICPFLQLQMCKGWFIDLCKILVNVCVLSLSFQKFIMVASSVVTIIVLRVW